MMLWNFKLIQNFVTNLKILMQRESKPSQHPSNDVVRNKLKENKTSGALEPMTCRLKEYIIIFIEAEILCVKI